jgi:hypothetical protein
MRVRLIRKLADVVDGIDISSCGVGDVMDLSPQDARLLIAEQWAIAEGISWREARVAQRGRTSEEHLARAS